MAELSVALGKKNAHVNLFMQLKRIEEGKNPFTGQPSEEARQAAYERVREAYRPEDFREYAENIYPPVIFPDRWEDCRTAMGFGAPPERAGGTAQRLHSGLSASVRFVKETGRRPVHRAHTSPKRGLADGAAPKTLPRTASITVETLLGESHFVPFLKKLVKFGDQKQKDFQDEVIALSAYGLHKPCNGGGYWRDPSELFTYYILYDLPIIHTLLFDEGGKVSVNDTLTPDERNALEVKFLQLACRMVDLRKSQSDQDYAVSASTEGYRWDKTAFAHYAGSGTAREKGLAHMQRCRRGFAARLQELGVPLQETRVADCSVRSR